MYFVSGFPGPRGVPGVDAFPGEKGSPGTNGFPGFPGHKGYKGNQGPPGYRGPNGVSGKKGKIEASDFAKDNLNMLGCLNTAEYGFLLVIFILRCERRTRVDGSSWSDWL